jgi:hypothetical protein
MIPGLAKYFDDAQSFLNMHVIGPSRGGDPAFGATSHSPDNPVSDMAPFLNLRTVWVRNWPITWVFSEAGGNIVDKCGFLTPIAPKTQSQRESYGNILILLIFLLTQK